MSHQFQRFPNYSFLRYSLALLLTLAFAGPAFSAAIYKFRDGKGVIVNVDAGTLWGTNQHGGHAVVVTDGTYDADGNLETVTVNDTGNGSTRTMPADELFAATEAREDNGQGASQMNVTRNPVMPFTRSCGSTTASRSLPMRQVPTGWKIVAPWLRANSSRSASLRASGPGRYSSSV